MAGLTCERASDLPCSVQMAQARRPCSGSWPGSTDPALGAWRWTARRSRAPIGPSAPHRLRDTATGPALDQRDPERRAAVALAWARRAGPHARSPRCARATGRRGIGEPQGAHALGWRSAAGQPRTRPRGRPGVIAARRAGSRPRHRGAPSVLRRSRTGSERPRDDGRARVAPRRGGAAYGRPNRGSLRRDGPADRRAGLGRPNTRGTRTWRDWSATKTSCRCTSTTRDRSWSRLGTRSGATATTRAGAATLAAWGRAIHVTRSDASPLQATVERLSQGPGRWDLILTGPRNAVRPSAPRREATTGR